MEYHFFASYWYCYARCMDVNSFIALYTLEIRVEKIGCSGKVLNIVTLLLKDTHWSFRWYVIDTITFMCVILYIFLMYHWLHQFILMLVPNTHLINNKYIIKNIAYVKLLYLQELWRPLWRVHHLGTKDSPEHKCKIFYKGDHSFKL